MTTFVRAALASDIDAIASIEAAAFTGDRLSRRSLLRLLAAETANILVAERSGAATGYCCVLSRKGTSIARLYSIAVNASSAERGTGGALLKAAESEAVLAGARAMRLEVREDNARAIALYKKSGYRAIGRRANYYEDGATALRFEKRLSPEEATAGRNGSE